MDNNSVLAMYDVRGIQNYIYKTEKVIDAIGASAIVENIIIEALESAIQSIGNLKAELQWDTAEAAITYEDKDLDVQVLYVGGGNGFVFFKSEELCVAVNKKMSKYILDNTYSLQLAAARVKKSDNYASDYKRLFDEMAKNKANMPDSRPLGALPIMDVEIKTGLPKSKCVPEGLGSYVDGSLESYLKKKKEKSVRNVDQFIKEFDTYVENKGTDSTLAVVHIDGNNMGMRIREIIGGIEDYKEAVNKMRLISHQINHCYKNAFTKMHDLFNKNEQYNVLKVLVAGDDITYVCKGKYAIASVEYFCQLISDKTMTGENDKKSVDLYGFSVCAGISYIGSHFPFSLGYKAAESCCDLAKDVAKLTENKLKVEYDGKVSYKIGNWFDFQFCKNIQGSNLDMVREKEYLTVAGERLMIRPYELPLFDLEERRNALNKYENLKKNIEYFIAEDEKSSSSSSKKNLPRSHAKSVRNTYSLGKPVMDQLVAFLDSRNWKMPDGTTNMYSDDNIALWYDAIELIDDYESLDSILENETSGKETN